MKFYKNSLFYEMFLLA